jgi:HD-like signal output (HDOD) protein
LALQRVLDIIINEVDSPDELASFISDDQALTARILCVANSAYYGFRGKVSNLTRSIIIIGYDEVKSICVYALMSEMFSGLNSIGRAEREKLWKHAFATARIAYHIAQRRPWVPKNQAYLLGLLHDLGRVVMAVHFKEEYRCIQKLAQDRKVPSRYVESQFGICHTLIGKWISIRWSFPELFQAVMEFHHEPEKSSLFKPEVRIVALANILANSQMYPEYLDDDFTRMYCQKLHITDEEWEEYQDRMGQLWPEVDQFWNLLK